MSTRNPKGWTAIRDIVWRGQDTLYRLKLGRETQHIADMIDRYYGGGNYPQSLAELSLEIYADKLRRAEIEGYSYWGHDGDVDKIRVAQWRKTRD